MVYVAELMTELKVKKQSALADCKEPLEEKKHYQKVCRYGNVKLKKLPVGKIEPVPQKTIDELLKSL